MKFDLHHPAPEREESLLLLAVSRAASFDEPADELSALESSPLAGSPFNWCKFVGLAHRQNCVAAAYRFTRDLGLEDVIPAEFADRLKGGFAQAQATYLKNLAELRELVDGLHRDGIPALVIKGIPLAVRLYADPAVRVSRDIDLLCRKEDLRHAERLAEDHGYSKHEGRMSEHDYRKYHYHLVYSKGAGEESVLEIHWNVRSPMRGPLVDVERLFEHTAQNDVGGTKVVTLDDSFSLWQLAVNLSYGGFLDARDLGDVRRLARRLGQEQWESVVSFSRNSRSHNEFSTALAVAERAFGVFVPPYARRATQPRPYIRTFLLPVYSQKRIAWRWVPLRATHGLTLNLFMREGIRRKINYMYRIVVPNRASLIETRASQAVPARFGESWRFRWNGVWIAAKVVGVSALLALLLKTPWLARRWFDPERLVRLRHVQHGVYSNEL